MRFANIYAVLLLLAVQLFYRIRSMQKPASVPHPDIISKHAFSGKQAGIKKHLPLILRIAALVLIVSALMRPQNAYVSDSQNTNGVDIMVAIDVNSSMTAEDFFPNRITAAKKVLADFIGQRKEDRIGLIVFGSESYVQCPLTNDHATLLSFLADINIGIAEDGTAIGTSLSNCVKRLKDSKARSKIILLLTDGDNNAGAIDPETAAQLAATYNIKIYTIGIGDPKGSPIPMYDQLGRKQYARNSDGSVFLTKMNYENLNKIADVSSGKAFMASNNNTLNLVFKEIDLLEKTKMNGKNNYIYDDLYRHTASIALLLLLLEFIASRYWIRRLL